MGYITLILIAGLLIFGVLAGFKLLPWKNAGIVALVASLVSAISLGSGLFSQTVDTEIWNGAVTSKDRERVSCEHSYQCNCRETCTGSGKDRSCYTTCDTCYEHTNDYDWMVRTTVGDVRIDRVDSQGAYQPPRWSVVKMDEPVAVSHRFTNYVKGAKNNVLNREGTKITYPMPAYPDSVYDYYKINRAVDTGVGVKNIEEWNNQISLALRKLGNAKQVNVVLVFTKHPEDYAEQLNAAWLGGKKNDVVVVIGVEDDTISWAKVVSWTKREDFKIGLREDLVGTKLDPVATLKIVSASIASKFDRREMAEFEYLKYDIDPPDWSIILALVSLFVVPVVYFIYLWRSHDTFKNRNRSSFNSRRNSARRSFFDRVRGGGV